MLAIAEPYFRAIAKARTDVSFTEILGQLACEFGFRSAYTIEYSDNRLSVRRVLDSDSRRSSWWSEYLDGPMRTSPAYLNALFESGPVLKLDASRFPDKTDPALALSRRGDMVDVTVVPVYHSGDLVGFAGFCGGEALDRRRQTVMQLIVYNFFSQVRSEQRMGIVTAAEPLTPREKEVIALSAEGLTSSQIAERLGVSARTVNQHVDNVADKLGTKNRAHTVAEAIRQHMF
jgi:LuxR family quorum sensing-dependent transcriptional regulator